MTALSWAVLAQRRPYNTIVFMLGIGRFTAATDSDTVTVTSTTVTGAKTLIYEKAAATPAITTGAGADAVTFEGAVSGISGIISTNSGNDSISFLENARVNNVQLGAGADSLYGAAIVSQSTISGGAGADTFLISTLSNALINGGADVDSISITGSLQVQRSTSEQATRTSRLGWCHSNLNRWWFW